MIFTQQIGVKTMVISAAQATNASATGIINREGASYINVLFQYAAQASTTSKPSIMKLQESDDTVASNFVDIPEMVGDGSAGFTIPPADTVNPQAVNLGLTLLGGRKKYIQAVFQPSGSAQDVAILGMLSRGDTEKLESASTLNHYA